MLSGSFKQLADTLQKPAIPPTKEPYWPYPLPEAEISIRYGLRTLSPSEQAVFPGLRLALHIHKVRLIKPPEGVPKARAGWIVWLAETYPGAYLMRLPGAPPCPFFIIRWYWKRLPWKRPPPPLRTFD